MTCGHPHSPTGLRTATPILCRVVEEVTAQTAFFDDRPHARIRLMPGTLLRVYQSGWDYQGCAGAEARFASWLFAVMDGTDAGHCAFITSWDQAGDVPSAIPTEAEFV